MNAELEYAAMQHRAADLRRAAANHRRVQEARKGPKSESRSVFARFLAS